MRDATTRPTPDRPAARPAVLVLTVCIATIGALGALEAGARAVAAVTHEVRGMGFDPELGWRPLPGVAKRGGVWGVTRPAVTNSKGWRDREHPFEKPPGVRRVVAIGDSFTFGVDADDGERWTDRLGALAGGLDVVNLGVAGYGPDQELRVLELEAFRYDPDAIVLTSCVLNDLTDIGYERLYSWPKPTFTLVDGDLVLRKPRLTWEIRVRDWSYAAEFLAQRTIVRNEAPVPAPGFEPSAAGALYGAIVGRMVALAATHHIPIVAVLAYAPGSRQPDHHAVSTVMRAALDRLGVPVLDARELFQRTASDPDQAFFSPVGQHWNSAGNALVARGVRDLLAGVGVP